MVELFYIHIFLSLFLYALWFNSWFLISNKIKMMKAVCWDDYFQCLYYNVHDVTLYYNAHDVKFPPPQPSRPWSVTAPPPLCVSPTPPSTPSPGTPSPCHSAPLSSVTCLQLAPIQTEVPGGFRWRCGAGSTPRTSGNSCWSKTKCILTLFWNYFKFIEL